VPVADKSNISNDQEAAMIENLLITFLTDMFVAPVQAELNDRFAQNVPPEVSAQVSACIAEAPRALVRRAQADPVWVVSSGWSILMQTATPESVLRTALPGCDAALKAAQPYLAKLGT
jgi:hypothetical protein